MMRLQIIDFGSDTAISGNYAIVGAMDEDVSGGTDSGAAYIFYNNGTTWSQQAKLTASDPAVSDKFGHRVDIERRLRDRRGIYEKLK